MKRTHLVGLVVLALALLVWIFLDGADPASRYEEQASDGASSPVGPESEPEPEPEPASAHDPDVPVQLPEEVPVLETPPTESIALDVPMPVVTPHAVFEEPEWDWDPPREVEIALRKAITWLKKKQQRNGSWGEIRPLSTVNTVDGPYGHNGALYLRHPAGPTALALFTLLSAFEIEKDPVIRKGFNYLKKYKRPGTTAERSMLLLALTATANRDLRKTRRGPRRGPVKLKGKYRSWATKLVDELVVHRTAQGWRYNVTKQAAPGGPQDLFNTNLAAWALYTAHRTGIKAKSKIWEDILAFSLAPQARDGSHQTFDEIDSPDEVRRGRARGFAYIQQHDGTPESRSTGSMTACGIANIALARHVLSEGESGRQRWRKRDDAERVQSALEDGAAWIDHFKSFENPNHYPWRVNHLCWLWNYQSAVAASGMTLGGRDWHARFGRELLSRQHPEGYWHLPGTWEPARVLDTCFAILYLTRATQRWVRR